MNLNPVLAVPQTSCFQKSTENRTEDEIWIENFLKNKITPTAAVPQLAQTYHKAKDTSIQIHVAKSLLHRSVEIIGNFD